MNSTGPLLQKWSRKFAWMNMLCSFFFSRLKNSFEGESIKATLWKPDRASAPYVLQHKNIEYCL